MADKTKIYPHVYKNIEDWPINKLSDDRTAFVKEINDFTLNRLLLKSPDDLNDIIAKTIYLERIRIKEEPWKVDPPNEGLFWKKTRKKLIEKSLDKEEQESKIATQEILKTIIGRYSEEIVGTFKISTFQFARKFLTILFNRLLNTAASRNLKRLYSSRYHLYERLKIVGDVEMIRSLFKEGTVVAVPTHFSNIDSIILGYVMDVVLGMPHFSYGAGLNLYNTGYTAYYMNRLGAYRIDRRKKNPIYLETLKGMSKLSIERGTNNLFFPGGTRSRSGSLEKKIKMGLLGTAVEAQRAIYQRSENRKVFIVPVVMSYPFVLEAKFLVEQYLKSIGKEQYMHMKDTSQSTRKIFKFIWRLFSEGSDITFSFGKPLDVLGNFVDAKGNSHDQHGNQIDVKDYFISDNIIKTDLQRESEYTKILADKIGERFHKESVVLSSHLVAFAAFNLLKSQNPNLDLFGLLRMPTEDYTFSADALAAAISQLKEVLIQMEQKELIKLSEQIYWEVDELIKNGINTLGQFHAQKPLKYNKKGVLISEDFKVLFYYHNRLENYNLDKKIKWKTMNSINLKEPLSKAVN